MTINDILPLYEQKFLHVDAIAFLLGTTRKGAQAAIYKARNDMYKRRPAKVYKENWDAFLRAFEQVEDKALEEVLNNNLAPVVLSKDNGNNNP